jgi:hypothetical protein
MTQSMSASGALDLNADSPPDEYGAGMTPLHTEVCRSQGCGPDLQEKVPRSRSSLFGRASHRGRYARAAEGVRYFQHF